MKIILHSKIIFDKASLKNTRINVMEGEIFLKTRKLSLQIALENTRIILVNTKIILRNTEILLRNKRLSLRTQIISSKAEIMLKRPKICPTITRIYLMEVKIVLDKPKKKHKNFPLEHKDDKGRK